MRFPYLLLVIPPLVFWGLVFVLANADKLGIGKLDGRGIHGLLVWVTFVVCGIGSVFVMKGLDRAQVARSQGDGKLGLFMWIAVLVGLLHFGAIFTGLILTHLLT